MSQSHVVPSKNIIFPKSFEIKPMFNFIRKSFILQLNICLKCLDHVTALLILLTVAKNLMPFTGV